jgi:succinyl-CoA synthetase beta subunit
LVKSQLDLSKISPPVVLKAQVPVGGRGKAGGIRIARTTSEITSLAESLFKFKIKGYPINALLAEEMVDARKEMYLAILNDQSTNLPMLIASSAGGVEIEQSAREDRSIVFRQPINLIVGLQPYMIRRLAKHLGVLDTSALLRLVEKMYEVFLKYDATLVEINPLVETSTGFVALDAKMTLDERAEYRQGLLFETLRQEQSEFDRVENNPAVSLARRYGVTYVPLSGDIAMIADGAGTGMLTLDLIMDEGGNAADFCEMGGLANGDVVYRAMEVVLANDNARVLLITLIGGLTRMDEIAEGIVRYVHQKGMKVPLVIRMCGTQEDVGKAMLRDLGIETFDDMTSAIQYTVDLARKV